MAAKKSQSKSATSSRPMNKKAMKSVKGGLLPAVAPTAMKAGMADGSVKVLVKEPVTFEL
jgi:hypothetical protein